MRTITIIFMVVVVILLIGIVIFTVFPNITTSYYCGEYLNYPYGENHSEIKLCFLNCVHGWNPDMEHWSTVYKDDYLRMPNGDLCVKEYN